jgi:HlyD family secretion protein
MSRNIHQQAMMVILITIIIPIGRSFGLDRPNRPGGEEVRRETTQPVHIEAYESTDVYAKASGFLKTVKFDIGDRVKKDQVLGELWIPEMDQELRQKAALVDQTSSAVKQAESHVAAAAAKVAAAEAMQEESVAAIAQYEAEWSYRLSEYERNVDLSESGSINVAVKEEKFKQKKSAEAALTSAKARVKTAQSQVKVEQANHQEALADLAFAQSQRKVAEANLEQTRILMRYAQVRAPFDGLITRRWVDSGDFVASATTNNTKPLFTVERDDRLRLVFDIPESKCTFCQVGQPTSMVVDAVKGTTFKGRIVRTAGVLDKRTRTLRVEAELDKPNGLLRPGMYGMITVTFGPPEPVAEARTR